MLKNTFLHIPGIGIITERQFWESGVHSWDDFTPNSSIRLSKSKRDTIAAYLEESYQNIESNNPNYFSDLLPANLQWRFFPEFRNSAVYLDIETTGLERWGNEITTIALYDGNSINYYVNGHNLDDFLNQIDKYNVIVTYNGKCFDVPFIESYFNIKLNHAHIDLRYILGSLGYKGGLKSCEAQLEIDRGDLKDIDGFFAPLLWYDYKKNRNEKALETLLAYNIQDVLSLENLMVIAYNLKITDTPFYGNQLPEKILPEIPFDVDIKTVERIKNDMRVDWVFEYFSNPDNLINERDGEKDKDISSLNANANFEVEEMKTKAQVKKLDVLEDWEYTEEWLNKKFGESYDNEKDKIRKALQSQSIDASISIRFYIEYYGPMLAPVQRHINRFIDMVNEGQFDKTKNFQEKWQFIDRLESLPNDLLRSNDKDMDKMHDYNYQKAPAQIVKIIDNLDKKRREAQEVLNALVSQLNDIAKREEQEEQKYDYQKLLKERSDYINKQSQIEMTHSKVREGTIYVLTNELMPGLVKIGLSMDNKTDPVADNKTDPPLGT
ncbi:MAG: ribonuclease H-like domain-containing protein [Proteobacteria bacterium]|nr:ribonuclease H-like domain-containing protein [Pseudomonadota bacterium]MBU4287396.1 ribonuclease H-like domain-containing protein [Pseudomonadota bacterium]